MEGARLAADAEIEGEPEEAEGGAREYHGTNTGERIITLSTI